MKFFITFFLIIFTTTAYAQKKSKPPKNIKKYKTITIGSQVWMAENLNIEIDGSWCYNNDPKMCKKYGRLYDWNTAKSACPTGFHLPSDVEWEQLTTHLGGQNIAGIKMKSTKGWLYNGNGKNSSGFNALPGGHRNTDSKFFDLGIDSYFWTSNEIGGQAVYRGLYNENGKVGNQISSKNTGMYVRCIKN